MQNNVTKLIEATLNSRDRKWENESLLIVKTAWDNIDQNLKVAVIGRSVLLCSAAVTLYKHEALLRKRPYKPFFPMQTTRTRSDYKGWSCRHFDTKEIP